MRRMIILAGLLLIAGVAAVLYYDPGGDGTMQNSPQGRRQVSVVLLGPAETLVGIDVPSGLAQQRTAYMRADEPSDVTLTLPNGRTMRLPVKYVSVTTAYATVTDVDLLPLERSVPFKEAVAELHRLLEALRITRDERMKEKMKREWPEDAPGFDPVKRPGFYPHTYDLGTALSDDTGFGVRLRAADDGGWFIVLTFSAQGPKRQAVRGRAGTRPSTPPAAQSNTHPDGGGADK